MGTFAVQLVATALSHLPAGELTDVEGAVSEIREMLNPEQYGGAHLVGTKGGVVIAHGASSDIAIFNAVRVASEGVKGGLVEQLGQRLLVK